MRRDPTRATVEVRFKLARREGFINARLAAIRNVPHTTRAHNFSLVAKREGSVFHWDIRLQGTGETVFFAF